ALGKEFLPKGANVLLGPGLNVHRVARGGRNVEYLSGESPYLGARLVKGYIEGVHAQNVLTVMKHFITNNQETNRNTVNSIVDERTLWEVYYPPFVASVEAGCLQAMCSYNIVNGVHACSSPDLLLEDLKTAMGYKGAVMSDWWALHEFSATAGLDMEMPGNSIDGNPMNQAYFTPNNTATLPLEKIQDMAARILIGVVRYGLMENPACTPANNGCQKQVYEVVSTTDSHKELATRMVAESVILLKNEKDVLPFSEDLKTIALLGSACNASNDVDAMLGQWDLGNYYTVGGSGRVIPKRPSTILDATIAYCQKAGCTVVSELQDNAQAALATAQSADLAVICSATTSAEGRDRPNLSVDQEDYVMAVAAGNLSIPKVSVSLIPGSIVMPWIHDVDAAVVLFLAGEATGSGLLQVLSGEVTPGAKSPVTFPFTEEDAIPPCENVTCEYKEGLWAGFPTYERKEVSFPFGHGLSYTSFSYLLQSLSAGCDSAAPAGTVVCAEVVLINSGATIGSEVVQLYLGYPSEAEMPLKLLRGFQKVKLQMGEVVNLQLPLTQKDISTWSPEKKEWVLLDGTYTVYIGSSSRDIRATEQFNITNGEVSF
ncbi:bglB, partial [Symbiodinium pilosum]